MKICYGQSNKWPHILCAARKVLRKKGKVRPAKGGSVGLGKLEMHIYWTRYHYKMIFRLGVV